MKSETQIIREYCERCGTTPEKATSLTMNHATNEARAMRPKTPHLLDPTSRHSDPKLKADEANLGTPEYQGLAWFWNHHYRHYLRDCGPERRIQVHHALIAAGLLLDDRSDEHDEIIEELSTARPQPAPTLESRIIIAHIG